MRKGIKGSHGVFQTQGELSLLHRNIGNGSRLLLTVYSSKKLRYLSSFLAGLRMAMTFF